jgi:ABC-type nitrate/sulfonate/bicarbonate transport system substrate-binding protein
MFSKTSLRHAISRVALIAVVVVVIIIIVGGSYVALSLSKNSSSLTSTSSATSNATTTSSSSTQATISTSSSSSTGTAASPSVVSTVPFTFCAPNPSGDIGSIAPVLVMQNQSYLQKYDPNAVLSATASQSTVTTQQLVAGQCQMAFYSQPTLVTSVLKSNISLTEVAVGQAGALFPVIVGANTSYTSISQLKTATWITTSFTLLEEEIVWAQQGWDASSITQVASSSPSASVTSVIAGKGVDMPTLAGALIPILEGQLRIVYNYTTPWPSNIIVTTPAFVQAHPDAVQAGVDALLAGSQFLNNPANQNYCVNLMLQTFPTYTPAQIAATISPSAAYFPPDGAISLGALQQLINAMYQYKQISANASASSLITRGFVSVGP